MSKQISDEAYGRFLLWLLNFRVDRHGNDAMLHLDLTAREISGACGNEAYHYLCIDGEMEATSPISKTIFTNYARDEAIAALHGETDFAEPYCKKLVDLVIEELLKASESISENTTHTQSPAKE